MSFLNLSIVEFLGLLSVASSFVVVLYLLDRSRRKQIVSTLRFWTTSSLPVQTQHRKRIQQPWSLLLQLISIALLLLAIAQPRWGSAEKSARNHVLILDTSAWMSARGLMEQAKTAALQYVRKLPSGDRIMLVRADALATPVTVLESDHRAVSSTATHRHRDESRQLRERRIDRRADHRHRARYVGRGDRAHPIAGALRAHGRRHIDRRRVQTSDDVAARRVDGIRIRRLASY